MNTYAQRVRDNILPLSVAGTLPEAFEEWSFTEKTVDHEDANETCQLCNKEQLRYHFEIQNSLTNHTLWVGSKCILQFGVSVFEGGVKLNPSDAKKKLNRLIDQMRLNSCLGALRRLATTEANKILANALAFYEKNKFLTPKFAFVVFWRLQHYGIDQSPSFFKISLRKEKYRQDLRDMPTKRVHIIWTALSPNQRRQALAFGHSPPNDA